MSVTHYENFPVASFLLPAKFRPAVEAIYHFARSADDIADEGDANDRTRLTALARFEQELSWIECNNQTSLRQFPELGNVLHKYNLPTQLLRDLLTAFKHDVVTKRYENFEQLIWYCQHSANPVGRLVLKLYGRDQEINLIHSDKICTALQLINFWQDVALDWTKGRIYIPLNELQQFGVSESDIANHRLSPEWKSLMEFQVQRAKTMMLEGSELVHRLPGRIGWELRFVVQGGLRIAERIIAVDYDVFNHRPTLRKRDWCYLTAKAITM